MSNRRLRWSRGVRDFLGVLLAGIHFPPLALPVDEGAVTGGRGRAVLGVSHPVVDEPEALAGLDGEGLRVVGHGLSEGAVRFFP